MMKQSAHARVTITVEVSVGSSWGDDCPISQVHKQAAQEAQEKLERLFEKERGNLRLVGEAKVTVIIVERA
jgi:hypothetical protein